MIDSILRLAREIVFHEQEAQRLQLRLEALVSGASQKHPAEDQAKLPDRILAFLVEHPHQCQRMFADGMGLDGYDVAQIDAVLTKLHADGKIVCTGSHPGGGMYLWALAPQPPPERDARCSVITWMMQHHSKKDEWTIKEVAKEVCFLMGIHAGQKEPELDSKVEGMIRGDLDLLVENGSVSVRIGDYHPPSPQRVRPNMRLYSMTGRVRRPTIKLEKPKELPAPTEREPMILKELENGQKTAQEIGATFVKQLGVSREQAYGMAHNSLSDLMKRGKVARAAAPRWTAGKIRPHKKETWVYSLVGEPIKKRIRVRSPEERAKDAVVGPLAPANGHVR